MTTPRDPGDRSQRHSIPSREQSNRHRQGVINRWQARPDIAARFAQIDEHRWAQLRTAGVNVERLIVPDGLTPPRQPRRR
ncbi:MAG TPA: hypothetical protein VFW09_17820 [Solirubrobacteraceae bacterium]|nr:hypothetical protein [Solirubrobacteraceae bacterium]